MSKPLILKPHTSGRLPPALSPQACLGVRCIKSESGNKAIEVGVIPADKAEEALRLQKGSWA